MSGLDADAREAWKRELEMAHSFMSTFGAKVKAVARDRETSIRSLAPLLGIEHTRLHRIAKGELLPAEWEMSVLLDWVYHDGETTSQEDKEAG